MNQENKECCPKFNPEKWDWKTLNWDNKLFIKESIPTLFHIPWPPMIGKKITKMCNMAENSDAALSDKEDILVLFSDPSPFKSELYMSVSKQVPEAENVEISGTFEAKVFDWKYSAVPEFIKQMDDHLDKQNKKSKKYYVHYAYCPWCAKEFGHNYMILFAKI